jgi:hypothetical protein
MEMYNPALITPYQFFTSLSPDEIARRVLKEAKNTPEIDTHKMQMSFIVDQGSGYKCHI